MGGAHTTFVDTVKVASLKLRYTENASHMYTYVYCFALSVLTNHLLSEIFGIWSATLTDLSTSLLS